MVNKFTLVKRRDRFGARYLSARSMHRIVRHRLINCADRAFDHRAALVFFTDTSSASKAAKRPSGGYAKKQKGDWWPEKQDRDHEEIASGFESTLNTVHDQMYEPHHPCSGNQKPDAKQSPTPIYGRWFVILPAE